MNRKNYSVSLIGGDMRQISAAKSLCEQGFDVSLYGFDTYKEVKSLPIADVKESTDMILLPVPVMRGDRMNMPFSDCRLTCSELAELLDRCKGAKIFGGVIPDALKDRGYDITDLCKDEAYNIMNSVSCAEGAVSIAMGNLRTTVCGSKTAVLGYGNIGKALASMLRALGAEVTVAARKRKDLCLAELNGMTPCAFGMLPERAKELDVIFNTVPSHVIGSDSLSVMKKDAFIIDLASKPGGVDGCEALRYGINVISAQSLPGKYAPVSAGRIIASCIVQMLEEGKGI